MVSEIKIYMSAKRIIRMILLVSLFVALGAFLISLPKEENIYRYYVGWACVLFFGLGFPAGIYQLYKIRTPKIILNEIGVFDRTLHKEFINWEVIQDAYLGAINNQKFIALVIDENFEPSKKKGKFMRSISNMNKALGFQELNLGLSMTDVDEEKLLQIILLLKGTPVSERNKVLKELSNF